MCNNGNNLSITEYPGLNDSVISLNNDFNKVKLDKYPTAALNVSKFASRSKRKVGGGRNSTKKFLRDARTEVRKRHNGSVDKRKQSDYRKNSGSRKRSEENTHNNSKIYQR